MKEIDSKELDRIVKSGKIVFGVITVFWLVFIFYLLFFAEN